jgi:D-arginine dehydrogenase
MNDLQRNYDFLVVGAGMAGASIGAELAVHGSVLVIEMEDQPGYHATGRSVAFWAETYGGPGVQPLTSASGPLLLNPPKDFSDTSFLSARGALHIGTQADVAKRQAMIDSFAGAGVGFASLDRGEIETRITGLRPEYTIGLAEPSTSDIDVAALHGAYLAQLRRRGGAVRTHCALVRAAQDAGGRWQVETSAGICSAGLIINAAGAWADDVARACGVRPMGISPLQRTVVQLRTDPAAAADTPIIMDLALNFYFKPVGQGRIWLSPHDETPMPPGDAAPEDLDVAIAIDRFEHVVDWQVEAVERKWAGLRSFSPDRLPVYGHDVRVPGFFWFAGQGGFGIQTAPAAARLACALVLGTEPDAAVAHINAAAYSPARFEQGMIRPER